MEYIHTEDYLSEKSVRCLIAYHPRSQALLAACVAISPGTNRMQKQFDWSFEYDGMWLFECEVSD